MGNGGREASESVMNRTIIITILLAITLATPGAIRGQDAYLGVRGGISVVDYSLPNLTEDWRSGGVAGAFLSLPVHGPLSFQGELSWVQKGAEWFKDGWGPTRALLDYGEAAALIRLSIPLGSTLSVSGLGGPWAAYLLSCSGDAPPGAGECGVVFGEDEYRRIDLGWTVGLGLGLGVGQWRSTLELRWSRGLEGILEDRSMDNPRTRSTQLTLGLGRRLGM